ncbi:hypothetical protein FOZ63_008813, partial [Perkinsus olseni]
ESSQPPAHRLSHTEPQFDLSEATDPGRMGVLRVVVSTLSPMVGILDGGNNGMNLLTDTINRAMTEDSSAWQHRNYAVLDCYHPFNGVIILNPMGQWIKLNVGLIVL